MRSPHLLAAAFVLTAAGLAHANANDTKFKDVDCSEHYWGRHRPKDLTTAFACFQAQEDWLFLTLAHLNGEGTPRDLGKARAAFSKIRAADAAAGMSRGATVAALEAALVAREKDAKLKTRVDYCKDIATDRPSLIPCVGMEEERAEDRGRVAIERQRKQVPARATAAFEAVRKAFDAFLAAEKDRVYQDYIDGTARGDAADGQAAFVREQFQARLAALTAQGAPAGARPFADADRALNELYARVYPASPASCEPAAAGKDPETCTQDQRALDERRGKARLAQQAWIRYRAACAQLARQLHPEAPAGQPEEALRSLITDDRLKELAFNPLGGK